MHDGAVTSAVEAYDVFAPYLRDYARTRAAYIDAVDRIVAGRIPEGAHSLVDVGAGDGERAVRIAAARAIPTVVLVEPSRALYERCLEQPVSRVWRVRAEELPVGSSRFDVVTCLWNVLGHVPSSAARVAALAGMRAMLAAGGTLFVDVNNRYNARAYGWAKTLGRIVYDAVRPSEHNGDVAVTWDAGGSPVRVPGHVFTPGEMTALVRAAGLRVRERVVVDYGTGAKRRFALGGQLLYELTAE